jgi:predicted polyphosphate/ATP-dependent NAD kinase
MESKGSSEILTRDNYEKHSFKELKLIMEQKIMSKVLNNPKTTQADIDEYAQIMQAVMDERQENDGEPLCMIV